VVVDDLHVGWARLGPLEANAPLIIDANAVLTFTVTGQCFKAIARRNFEASSMAAALSIASFRIATVAMFAHRGTREPSKRRRVSSSLKL
jgi:hypothetical protein